MATDLFKQVLFNDGEELTYGDLNDQENFADAMLTDQILESLVGNFTLTGVDPLFSGAVQADAANHLAYCLRGGSAYLRQGSASNKVQIAPGVLFQKTANKTGNASTLLPYYFDGSSTYEFTIAAGSANPRVDLLQMSLTMVSGNSQTRDFKDATTGAITSQTMNKKRQVQCTLSVKQGTPAASPTIPDPDAGYVAVGCVIVTSTYTTGTSLTFGVDPSPTNNAFVWDQRMPMQVRCFRPSPETWRLATAWSLVAIASGQAAQSSSTTNDLRIRISPGGNSSRLTALEFYKDVGAWSSTASSLNVPGSTGSNKLQALNNGVARIIIPYYTLEQNFTLGGGITVVASTTNKIGAPAWSNGYRCAVPTSASNSTYAPPYLLINSSLNLSQLSEVVAYWAG